MNFTLTSHRPAPAAKASARTGAPAGRAVAKAGAAIWRALEAVGRARAQAHLLALADRCEAQQPDMARDLRAAARRGPLD